LHLPQIIQTLRVMPAILRAGQRRQKHARQNPNDRNHHQQLNERKAPRLRPAGFLAVHTNNLLNELPFRHRIDNLQQLA
jgi:hypothetical protein